MNQDPYLMLLKHLKRLQTRGVSPPTTRAITLERITSCMVMPAVPRLPVTLLISADEFCIG
jgi:hypothetical protein